VRGQSSSQSLAGSLLLAHPALRDPNFKRAVVLMSAHNEEGAMGVVLNRPLKKKLGDLKGPLALGPLSSAPVFNGGPVQTDQLILVAWQMRDDGFRLHFGIDPEKAGELLAEEGTDVRAFMGYSGWSAGQLENELTSQTWIVTEAPGDLFSQPSGAELWSETLRREGDDWRLLADEPEHPEQN
jgi:putative transcriptional regulator